MNHDLNFLYTIARTVLPKDVLETLMYGSDFDDPSVKDINEIKKLIESNHYRMPYISDVHDVDEYYEAEADLIDDFACPVCRGEH